MIFLDSTKNAGVSCSSQPQPQVVFPSQAVQQAVLSLSLLNSSTAAVASSLGLFSVVRHSRHALS